MRTAAASSWDLDCARLYLGPQSAPAADVEVLSGDARVFPPTLVHVGEDEILLSDSTRLADAIRRAGGSVDLKIWPGLWHVFQAWAPQLPEAGQSIAEIGRFISAASRAREAT